MSKKTIGLLSTALLAALLTALFLFYQVVWLKIRANVVAEPFSKENSYVFLTPLQAKADGIEKIRVTVFVLNNQGLGVADRNVTWQDQEGLIGEIVQNPTDNLGRANIDFVSKTPGQYRIEIRVDNEALDQKVNLRFN